MPFAPAKSDDLANLKAIERRFVDEVEAVGVKPVRREPTIRYETSAILATYNREENTIHILRWNSAPLPAKATFNLMAIYCKDGVTGEKLFTESYSRLFFAHELGHWLQLQFHHGPIDQYQLEREANRIAVAFWSSQPEDRAWLVRMIERYKQVRSQFPNPVPKGEDPASYFNRNWKEWVRNGKLEYGAYQIRMVIDEWEDSNRPSFAEIVRQVSEGGPNRSPQTTHPSTNFPLKPSIHLQYSRSAGHALHLRRCSEVEPWRIRFGLGREPTESRAVSSSPGLEPQD